MYGLKARVVMNNCMHTDDNSGYAETRLECRPEWAGLRDENRKTMERKVVTGGERLNSQLNYASFQLATPSSFQPAGSELAPVGSRTARGALLALSMNEREGCRGGFSVGWGVVTPPTKASLEAGVAPHASFRCVWTCSPNSWVGYGLRLSVDGGGRAFSILLEEQQPKCAKCARGRAGDPASSVVSVAGPLGQLVFATGFAEGEGGCVRLFKP
jgi:hypothetical protein